MAYYATKVVMDMDTLEVLECIRVPYDGPWALCKSNPSQQQMNTENQQMQLQNQIAQQQLGMQQGQINMVNPTLQAMIANGGLTPQQLSAVQANTINALPQTYNNLYSALSQQLAAHGVTGGQNAGGGDIARQFGALGAQEAGQAQQGQFNIAQLQQQGLLGAMNTALGIGGQYGQNFGTATSGASSAGGSATSAANEATQAQSNFWGSLMGALSSPFNITAKV